MNIVEKIGLEVQRRLDDQGAGHGFDHALRVLQNARQIQAETGGDLLVVELASLVHDVGDAKFHHGKELSGQFAREMLTQLNVGEETIRHVVQIVDNISFRKRQTAESLSLEGQIVQDADRLDALGAIGIVRTIEYSVAVGRPFYSPDTRDPKTGVGHFYEKLFKLKDLMNTAPARRMAEHRDQFMRRFLEQFLLEQFLSEQAEHHLTV